MTMQDPISDMFARVRNALLVKKPEVRIPASKIKIAIAKVLKDEGYITGYCLQEQGGSKSDLILSLKYHQGKAVIEKLRRISRPGLRVYRDKDKLPRILNGLGIAIISTPQGVMSDRMARSLNVGGEVLCYVY